MNHKVGDLVLFDLHKKLLAIIVEDLGVEADLQYIIEIEDVKRTRFKCGWGAINGMKQDLLKVVNE